MRSLPSNGLVNFALTGVAGAASLAPHCVACASRRARVLQIPYTCSSGMLIVLRHPKPSGGGEPGLAGGARGCRREKNMTITTAITSVPKPAPDLIEAFRGLPTSVISD